VHSDSELLNERPGLIAPAADELIRNLNDQLFAQRERHLGAVVDLVMRNAAATGELSAVT